jgi:hypothetical protein
LVHLYFDCDDCSTRYAHILSFAMPTQSRFHYAAYSWSCVYCYYDLSHPVSALDAGFLCSIIIVSLFVIFSITLYVLYLIVSAIEVLFQLRFPCKLVSMAFELVHISATSLKVNLASAGSLYDRIQCSQSLLLDIFIPSQHLWPQRWFPFRPLPSPGDISSHPCSLP